MRHAALAAPDVLPLRNGDKFAVYTFKRLWPVPAFQELHAVRGACWVYPGPIFLPDEFWTEQMGERFSEIFAEGSFTIMTRRRARQPMVVDAEDRELIDDARQIGRGVLLHGRMKFKACAALAGNWHKGRAEISTVSCEVRDLLPFGARPNVVGKRLMQRAVEIYRTLRGLEGQSDPARMGRGYFALVRALREENFAERLSLLVRAIEGLLYLEEGRGADAFAERASFFAGAGSEAMLRELYRMRGRIAHVQSWSSAMGHHGLDARGPIAEQRLRQADVLACEMYSRVLACQRICNHFSSDLSQARFWQLSDGERRRVWGPAIRVDRVR